MTSLYNNWFVLTGGPSSGKTTLINELTKLGYVAVPEAARLYFESRLARGQSIEDIRADEKYCQEEICRLKIYIENLQPKLPITFFDRGMQDTLAYMRYYNYPIDPWIYEACDQADYQKIFLLEPLDTFEKDEVRSTEPDNFAQEITSLLREAYEETDQAVELVPVMPVADRLQYILDRINTSLLVPKTEELANA